MLPSIKEAQAHLTKSGDRRVLDQTLLRAEADISPEIQLRIITNKIKKDQEAEGTSKKKKDPTSHDETEGDRVKFAENFEQQQKYLAKSNNKCDVADGSCKFAQVKDFVARIYRAHICHFFSTYVFLGSIFLHMKAHKLWQNKFLDKTA